MQNTFNFNSKHSILKSEEFKDIRVVIGLGNPGSRFDFTRHNIGFYLVEKAVGFLDGEFGFGKNCLYYDHDFMIDNKLRSVMFCKPDTYMNDSGKIWSFLSKKGIKIEQVLVVHDEIEKPFNYQGFRFGGSAKGHNGLRSLIEHAGMNFWRFRFGVGKPDKNSKITVADHVLKRFSSDEMEELPFAAQNFINLFT